MILNPSFVILVILSVLAVSTKDIESVSSQSGRHFVSKENLLKDNKQSELKTVQKLLHQNELVDGFNYKNVTLQHERTDYKKLSKSQNKSQLNADNITALGLLVLGSLALVSPMVLPEFRRNMERSLNPEERQSISNFITSRLVGVSESIMGWVEKSVDDLPSFPRLDAQECMKRCICEAHNQPKKYGIIGLVLQLFFPPYTEAEEPLKVVSKYQLAARYGRQDNANCATQYDGCMVNFLDVVQGLINLVF